MLDSKMINRRAFCCGKTFRVYYPQKTTHSATFWLDWFKSVSHCNQQGLNGQTLVMCIRPELSRGESSMLNTSDSPNDASACSLWQVLEKEASPKYFLSAKACKGILNRAEKRNKVLPATLREALERIANPYWGGLVKASGGALGGGSETIVVHGTQDPIISTSTAHCLGRNNGQENVLFDISERRDVVRIQKDGTTPTLTARMGTGGNNSPCMSINQNIRKLTPSECEKLQGFPPGYTQIPYRNKLANDCPDSPRYKAIGNSMAVPVIKWIGERMINYLNK